MTVCRRNLSISVRGISKCRSARDARKSCTCSFIKGGCAGFTKKAAEVIGLYLKPPANAVVFCVDEKTAIQALDRLDPVLPLSPGRAERHGFEYFRHRTLSLYAALNTQTGAVFGQDHRQEKLFT